MSGVSAPTTAVIRLSAHVVVSPSAEDSGEVDTTLSYSVRDPYEVQVSFQRRQSTSVVWRFARELLAEARVEGQAGDGDVQVQWEDDEDCILVLHGGAGSTARVALPGRRVALFLARITRMVPMGAEQRHLHVPDHLPSDW